MKITVDLDCTPEELRTFFGLPDVRPMQEAILNEVQRKILNNINAMDPEVILKNWVPASMQGMEQLQQAFWQGVANMTGMAGKKPARDEPAEKK